MEDNTYLAIGSILDRRYEIKRHLASGGFGKTYLVTTKLGGHKKVVKEFFLSNFCERDAKTNKVTISGSKHKEIFDTQKRKFLREAERCHSMQHPNIVWVSDLFEANGTAYYVMDYVDGETLEDKMQKLKGKPMPEDEVMRYLNQMLSALEYVHAKGFLHLDIKPGNIMVDKAGNAMLIDFGASKQFDIDSDEQNVVTTTAGLAYTPGYAPFEQQMGQIDALGPYSDIYALGATLYRLLVAKKPPTAMEIQEQGMPKMDNITPVLANVITKSMAFSRNDRLGSVAEIRALLNDETACLPKNDIKKDIPKDEVITQPFENKPTKITKKIKWTIAIGVAITIGIMSAEIWSHFNRPNPIVSDKFEYALNLLDSHVADSVKTGFYAMKTLADQGNDKAKIEIGMTYFANDSNKIITQRRTLLNKGNERIQSELKTAIKYLSSINDESTITPEVYYILGGAYYYTGDTLNALRNFEKALALLNLDKITSHGYNNKKLKENIESNISILKDND